MKKETENQKIIRLLEEILKEVKREEVYKEVLQWGREDLNSTTSGYHCFLCGDWVLAGVSHRCPSNL